jgi:prophage regulatory protein
MNAVRHEEPVEFIDIHEVRKISGFGTSKIYEMAREGLFPKQVSLGTRTVRWVRSEVQQWAVDQVKASRPQPDQSPASSPSR